MLSPSSDDVIYEQLLTHYHTSNTDLHKIGELEPYDGSLLGKPPTRSHKSWHGVNFSTFIFPLQKAIHIRYIQILTETKNY